MKISEINIQLIKPVNGLVAFASVVLDDKIYLGSIGVHSRLDGTGYRHTYEVGAMLSAEQVKQFQVLYERRFGR